MNGSGTGERRSLERSEDVIGFRSTQEVNCFLVRLLATRLAVLIATVLSYTSCLYSSSSCIYDWCGGLDAIRTGVCAFGETELCTDLLSGILRRVESVLALERVSIGRAIERSEHSASSLTMFAVDCMLRACSDLTLASICSLKPGL